MPTGEFMNRLLIVGILIISTAPLFAQAQQPDMAKLKTDAQKVISIIRGDKAKTEAYCQLDSISEQIDQATEAGDTKKVDALSQQTEELEKKLGPEYRTLFDTLNDADPDSQEVKDILSMFDTLAESCPH
jgi:DNA repair ATPase RecN